MTFIDFVIYWITWSVGGLELGMDTSVLLFSIPNRFDDGGLIQDIYVCSLIVKLNCGVSQVYVDHCL